MQQSWSVDGTDLNTKTRSGGANAEKGFTFQKAYALVRLSWLPLGERGLVELRYEGAQDVDLRYIDGEEVLTQAKDHNFGNLTYNKLKEVIAGFARDLITATARRREGTKLPRFRLVCTSAPQDEGSFEILRRKYTANHAQAIEPLIQNNYREGMESSHVRQCVADVLLSTEFEIILNDQAIKDLLAQASWNLVRFGVPPDFVNQSLAQLQMALVPRATFQVSDVVERFVGLPEGHPGKENSACRLLPTRRTLELTESIKTAFFRGAMHSLWAGIHNRLDVERDESTEVRRVLGDAEITGGLIVIEGSPGTGKSALLRRVAWDAHCAGTHLVLEVASPGEMQEVNWKALLDLHRLSSKPLLLLVDDIWRHPDFVEEFQNKVRPDLNVLATNRPTARVHTADYPKLAIYNVDLGRLSNDFAAALRSRLRTKEKEVIPLTSGQIARFTEEGQVLALSLTLQGGSLDEYASRLLKPLRNKTNFKEFLYLCVAGYYDQSAPASIFQRMTSTATPFWRDKDYIGLVALRETRGRAPRLQVGHSLVARSIISAENVDLLDKAIELCEFCEVKNVEERRFIIRLLRSTLAEPSLKQSAQEKGGKLGNALSRFTEQASFADAHRLATILTLVGRIELARAFTSVATPDRIRDRVDVGLALSRHNREELDALFPYVLKFFELRDDAVVRKRFVNMAIKHSNASQQIAVIQQTTEWCLRTNFPPDETIAVLNLGSSAKDITGTKQLAPLIRAYLAREVVEVEILLAAVFPIKRLKNIDLSRMILEKALTIIPLGVQWEPPHIELARRASLLVNYAADDSIRDKVGALLMQMLPKVSDKDQKVRIVNSAIFVRATKTRHSIAEAISVMRDQRWVEAEQLSAFMLSQFGTSD